MATGSTTNYSFPYPKQTDPVNVAIDVQALADSVDSQLQEIIEDKTAAMFTGASVSNGITLPQYNDTTGKMVLSLNQNLSTSGTPSFSGLSLTAKLSTVASSASSSGLVIPHGTAPTSPVNGDMWTTTSGLFTRINGTTEQYAKLASPSFSGVPLSTTAAADTNTTQIATTAFVIGQASSTNPLMDNAASIGTSLKYARADHAHPSDTTKANLASPGLTGIPTAPTASVDTNTTQIATTAFIIGQGYLKSSIASSTYAPLINPTLTGTPLSTTASVDTNTTQIATTAFVIGQASSVNPSAIGSVSVGTSNRYARADHVHPTTGLGLTSGKLSQFASTTSAELAGIISDETGSGFLVFSTSPTLSGVPLSTTASVDTNTTQIATTAFVIGQGYLKLSSASSTYAPLLSPTFTGKVTTPATTVSAASINIPHGTSPTIPTDGDVWTTSAGLYVQVNGSTVGPLGTGSGGGGGANLTDILMFAGM